MNISDVIKKWIRLSKSDLKSARILYLNGQFRTGYFHFQQASEKANKAFAIYSGMADEHELRSMRHDQFKIYRKKVSEDAAKYKKFIEQTEQLPIGGKEGQLLSIEKMQSVHDALIESTRMIDGLKARDLVNISSIELNRLIKQLEALRKPRIILPTNAKVPIRRTILKIAESLEDFETEEALAARKKFEEIAYDDVQSKKVFSLMIQMLGIATDISFIIFTLGACALLTTQHSSLTRYPEKGKDPLKIYTAKLPLIRKQIQFMDLLEEVLKRMLRLNK